MKLRAWLMPEGHFDSLEPGDSVDEDDLKDMTPLGEAVDMQDDMCWCKYPAKLNKVTAKFGVEIWEVRGPEYMDAVGCERYFFAHGADAEGVPDGKAICIEFIGYDDSIVCHYPEECYYCV